MGHDINIFEKIFCIKISNKNYRILFEKSLKSKNSINKNSQNSKTFYKNVMTKYLKSIKNKN